VKTAAGVLLVIAHALALPYLVRACARPDLVVTVDGPTVARPLQGGADGSWNGPASSVAPTSRV